MSRIFDGRKIVALVAGIYFGCLAESHAQSVQAHAAIRPATPSLGQAQYLDVILRQTGQLYGVVLRPAGGVSPGSRVWLEQPGAEPRQVSSDGSGRFTIPSVSPGVYTLTVAGTEGRHRSIVRAWAAEHGPAHSDPVAVVRLQPGEPEPMPPMPPANAAPQPESSTVQDEEPAVAPLPSGRPGLFGDNLVESAVVVGGTGLLIAIPFIGDEGLDLAPASP